MVSSNAQKLNISKPRLKVAIFQYLCRQEGPAERLARMGEAMAQAAAQGAEILVCPELFLSGYNTGDLIAKRAEPVNGPAATMAAMLARQHGIAVHYGYPERDGELLYNSAICIDSSGRRISNHRKLILPSAYEKFYFTPGLAPTLFEFKGWRIATLICYDVEFPESVRAAAGFGADLIIAPTALTDNWTVIARAVIPANAFCNSVFIAYANFAGREGKLAYLGESRLVSATGEDLAVAGSGEEVIVAEFDTAIVPALRQRLPYLVDLDTLAPLLEAQPASEAEAKLGEEILGPGEDIPAT